MAWTRYQIILATLLVFSGSFNTLSMKWADKIKSKGIDGKEKEFKHPFFQALVMFSGEILCLVAFKILYYYYRNKDNSENERTLVRGNREFSSWIFFLPAVCDVVASSVVYIGLTLTYASSFQMLRGSLIIFVALLSITFLRRRFSYVEWTGVFFVVCGLALVGLSDYIVGKTEDKTDALIGDFLVVGAQVITALQIVLEEHFVAGKDVPPLQAVGFEGCFGFTVLGFMLIPLYYIKAGNPFSTNPDGRLEDLRDVFKQIENNLTLLIPLIGNAISIAFFNFAGIGVTKELSGTCRTVLDSVRIFFVWAASLIFGWQKFSWIEVVGFIVLMIGILVYNDVLIPSAVKKIWHAIRSRRERMTRKDEDLLNEAPDEVTQ